MAKKINQQYGVPALLSFFVPGLGQIIKGQVKRGILFFFLSIFSILLLSIFIGFITTPIFWIYQIYDAYNNNNLNDTWKF